MNNALLFTRGTVTIPAAISEMDVRTFAVLSAVGTLVFESIFAAVALGLLEWLG